MEYDVNFLSKRPLQNGQLYDRYFKNSSCTPSYLGTNDTAFTVAQMKNWAYKNARQTKELSLEVFKGKSLQSTVAAIYDFLYHHFQYEVDGRNQNLKSPACAWATREKGMDCKSYSIFASTILINLGIKHYYRRVKQPGDNANLWTHVYVVVPKDQKTLKADSPEQYYVIDATVHQNNEVSYSKKSDTLMSKVSLPNYGLQGPSFRGLAGRGLAGCVCTPKAKPVSNITQRPVSTRDTQYTPPVTIRESNLTYVPNPVAATPRVTTPVPTPTPTPVTRSSTRTTSTSSTATPRVTATRTTTTTAPRSVGGGGGSNVRIAPTTALRAPATTPQPSNNTTTYLVNGLTTIGNGVKNGSSAGTIIKSTAGTAAATIAALAPAAGPAAPIALVAAGLIALAPDRVYNKVIAQFFANGLRLKCIGSSRSPAGAKKDLEKFLPPLKSEAQKMYSKIQMMTPQNAVVVINEFMKYFYSIDAKGRHWLANGARDCTRDGLIVSVKGLDKAKDEIINTLTQIMQSAGAQLIKTGTTTVVYPANPDIDKPDTPFEVEQFTVIAPQQTVQNTPQIAQQFGQTQNKGLLNFNGISQLTGGINSTTGILILASLAAGTYLYKNS